MDFLLDWMAFIPVLALLEAVGIVCSVLFMHFSAQYRNYKLSLGWYICGVVFGLWTLMVFLIKRKEFPGPKTKVCCQCERKFPDSFQMCSNCLIDLPEIKAEEKEKQRKLSKIFGIGVIITLVTILILGGVMGAKFSGEIIGALSETTERISVDGVFYDKKGIAYEDGESVLLYDKEGRTYTYTVEEVEDEYDFTYEEYYYVRDDGKKYYFYDCYVTQEGWFYCDKAYILEPYSPDTENMNEQELDAYYEQMIEYDSDYKYYNIPYTDEKGNFYYTAYEASWNEKGELITAENDVTE